MEEMGNVFWGWDAGCLCGDTGRRGVRVLLGGNWGLSCHFSPFAHTEQRSAVLLINFVFLMFWKPSAGRSKLDLVSFLG